MSGSQSALSRARSSPAVAAVISKSAERVPTWPCTAEEAQWALPLRSSAKRTSSDPTIASGNTGSASTTLATPSPSPEVSQRNPASSATPVSTAMPARARFTAQAAALAATPPESPLAVLVGSLGALPGASASSQPRLRASTTTSPPTKVELSSPTVAIANPKAWPPGKPRAA